MYNLKSPFVKSESDNKKIPVIKSGKSKPKKFAEGTSSVSDGGNPKKGKSNADHNNALGKKYGVRIPGDNTRKYSEKEVKEYARKKAAEQANTGGSSRY